MNADTKKKIMAENYLYTNPPRDGRDPSTFAYAAEFGYNLAIQDAEVLVKALEEHCKIDGNYKGCSLCEALEQWKKVTE